MKTLTASVALLAATIASPAIAASDGTLGPTSSGTFTVNVSISADASDDVHVYGLDDFSFSGSEGESINSQEEAFCIIRTPNNGPVNVTISSFDAADVGVFKVKTLGGAEDIQMLVGVRTSDSVNHQMTEGTPTEISVSETCAENDSLTALSVPISLLNASGVGPGNYAGSFLVTVAPN